MQSLISKEEWTFDGREMVPHWAYIRFGVLGDSVIAFVGPSEIPRENLIDLEEYKGNTRIHAEKMLHFVVEHFDDDLEKAILRQYLLISILEEKITNRLKDKRILRWGDDLYEEDHKLTVSAVTKNVVSTKIHLGINVVPSIITPKTRGLSNYGIDPFELAEAVIAQYRLEIKRTRDKIYRMRTII